MPVHKIIFRLDYEANFKMFDRPGEVLDHLGALERKSSPKADGLIYKLFPNLAHDAIGHKVTAGYEDDKSIMSLTVEPASIVLNAEFAEGINWDDIGADKKITLAVEACSSICEKFNIQNIQRLALRGFYFGKSLPSSEIALVAFSNLISSSYREIISNEMGGVKDNGIHFVGENLDGLQYRCAFGPYFPGESMRWLQHRTFSSIIDIENKYTLMADIDMFEAAVSRSTFSELRWLSRVCDRACGFVKKIEELLPISSSHVGLEALDA